MEENNKKQKEETPETTKDLKNQAVDKKEVKKGYNEKNPVQPEGSFKPDSTTPDN